MRKTTIVLWVAALLSSANHATAEINADSLKSRLDAVSADHPRLFLDESEWPSLKSKANNDPLLSETLDLLLAYADVMLDLNALTRKQTGKRLLGVSRACLQRVSYLAMAYRMTGDAPYALRAEQEMLAVAAFTDWNPSHFLDVAEMTAALAIGYDWLYDVLPPESRTKIRNAIIDKGLKTSLKGGWWVTTQNNWNQVCHGGLTLGALAVLEDEPELAEKIIARALKNIPRALHEYEPDGIYPEGPGYWKYGTTYNVLLIDALESVLETDFGITSYPGFKKTPYFYLHSTGPTGLFFNFADGGTYGGVAPAMHWFAARMGDPSLLWHERRNLEAFVKGSPSATATGLRTLPFLLIWSQPTDTVPEPSQLHWSGDSTSPVVLSRSSWDKTATFIGFKGGSPSTNHGHMDIGSFVLDMKGQRWAVDLGAQDYNSLETQGVDLWNRQQDSDRWTVFRLNNTAHNTLVVDGAPQRVDAHAPIIASSETSEYSYAVIDMSAVYQQTLSRASRGIQKGINWALIQDDLTALDHPTSVRWGMITRAKVTITTTNSAILEQAGEQINLTILKPANAKLRVVSIETPPRDFDAKNSNTRMILFDVPLAPSQETTIAVQISADSTVILQSNLSPLKSWSSN